jgi:hypothetical protein
VRNQYEDGIETDPQRTRDLANHVPGEPKEVNKIRDLAACNELIECPCCLRLFLHKLCTGHEYKDVSYPPCIAGQFPDYLTPSKLEKQDALLFHPGSDEMDINAIDVAIGTLEHSIREANARIEELKQLKDAQIQRRNEIVMTRGFYPTVISLSDD